MDYLQKKLRPLINNSKIPAFQAVAFIKNDFNPGDFETAIESKSLYKKIKLQNSSFKSIEDVVQREPFIFTNDIKKELFWLLYNIKQESKKIDGFLLLKKKFEDSFLLSNYEEAYTILQTIRNEFGENLWTIEMSLLLKEFQYNTKENWSELSNLLSKLNSPFYQFFVNFFSKRIEENMSFDNCISQFQSDFDGVICDKMIKDFLVFKSLYNAANFDYAYKNFEGVLYLANMFSTIDQYLIAIDVAIKLISYESKNDPIILQFVSKILPLISNDDKLFNIVNLIDKKKEVIVLENTVPILLILDEYSIGNFENCIKLCVDALKIKPSVFELYEIYCKSLINLNLDFENLNFSPLIDKILFSVYNSLLYNNESETYCYKLLKYSLALLSFDFGKKLSAFVTSLGKDVLMNHHSLIGCLSSTINNPRLLNLNLDSREENFIKKNECFMVSESFKINLFINGDNSQSNLIFSQNQLQSDVYKTRSLFYQSKFEEVIKIVEFYVGKSASPFYYDNILHLLFQSYIYTNRLKEAIILTATIISDKVFFTNKFNIEVLINKIQTKGHEVFANLIELPILFSLIKKDYDLYEIYIDYMLTYEEEYPSKLNIEDIVKIYSIEKVVYFLKEVCTVSTIRYSLEFKSIDEAEQERYEICMLLKKIDSSNNLIYEREISDLLRTGAVRKALKEFNAGRLYVNVESLKNLQSKNVKENFLRYKEIEMITKDKNLIGFNPSKVEQWVNYTDSQNNSQFDNPSFLAFKAIYLETREKFLFSKEYGLDSCLSTNFRHGAVKNHLRSVFEKLNLVTVKEDEEYIDNYYWSERKVADYNSNYKIQERLKKFSQEIDEYTDYIRDNLIQIQTERFTDNKEGLFRYFTNDTLLLDFFQEHKTRFVSGDSIMEIIYSGLIQTTIFEIFQNIYEKFTISINNTFQKYVEDLQSDLRLLGVSNQSELLPNIIKSSTDIQSELEIIAESFFLNTTSSFSLLDIETIINASVEYTNKINPNNCISPEICIQFSLPAYSSLIFVFNNFFNNIIEHSKLSSEDLKVKIEVFNPKGNYLEVKVSNNISPLVNISETQKKLKIVKENWNNHENIERSNTEGGSGFDKIKRILLYEVIAKTDKFEYSVNAEEVQISLFLPFKPFTIKIENIISASMATYYTKVSSVEYIEPIITINYPSFVVSSSLVVVFNLMIENIIKHSGLQIEHLKIKFEVFEPKNEVIEIKITNNISEQVDIQIIESNLKSIKDNWKNYVDLGDSNTKYVSGFDLIKHTLYYDMVSKTEEFEFFVSRKEVSISLFLPLNQPENEKNINN